MTERSQGKEASLGSVSTEVSPNASEANPAGGKSEDQLVRSPGGKAAKGHTPFGPGGRRPESGHGYARNPRHKASRAMNTPSNDGDGVSRDVALLVLCRAKRLQTEPDRDATGVQASGSRCGCSEHLRGAQGKPTARRKEQQSERGNHGGCPLQRADGHLRLMWPSWGGGVVVVGGGQHPLHGEGPQLPAEVHCERKS
jgi:hypothetical protein